MSEETEEVQTEENETPKETKGRPEGLPEDQEWDRVDFETADPETIQRRFNRLYAGQKTTENALKQAAEDNRKLADRLEEIERNRTEQDNSRRLSELKQEKIKALEEGETARAVEIDDQILDIKTAEKPAPKVEKEEIQEPGWFTPQKQQALVNWASESDGNGNLKRPWAEEGHPKNPRCIEITNAVLNDPDFAGADMTEILSEVDRLMTPRQKKPSAAPVLSGGDAPRETKKTSVKLTEEQKLVARRMYNDLKPEDAVKRYAASLARMEGTA